MQQYRQVSGGNCRLVLYRETTPGQVDKTDTGVLLSFASESFAAPPNKQGSSVITGKRGQGKPFSEPPNYTGGVSMAPYAPIMGHVLRALCGKPTTTRQAPFILDSTPVMDEGGGCVGILCKGHDFVQDTVISIVGTVNYDGIYRLQYGTTPDKLVILAPFVDETPTGSNAYRGLVAVLDGDARDMGTGKVGLPVEGIGVALHAGESVVIDGTENYDGEHVLLPGTSPRLLVIAATHKEEKFEGIGTAAPVFWRHEFVLPRHQPTVTVEKYLDFEADAASYPYEAFGSNKVNGLSFPFGGEGELLMQVDFSVGFAQPLPGPVTAAAPAELPSVNFAKKEIALWLDSVRIGDIETGNIAMTYGIEAKAAVGDMGRRTRQSEGDPVCTVTMDAFLEHDEYSRLSDMSATVPFALSISGAGGDEFWVRYPESEVATGGAAISGKAGLTQNLTITAFVDQANSVNTFALINRVASYA